MTAPLISGVRAAIWDGTKLIVDEVSLLPPSAGEVTVRVLASGICHSDLNVIDGRAPLPAPVVLGHEAAGVVERIGGDVDSVAVGDEVMISSMTPCGECPSCRAHRPSRCRAAYGRPSFPFRWRGSHVRSYANVSSFATHVTVRAAQLFSTTGIPPASGALIGCAVSTGWGAVTNVAQVAAGEIVVVIGIGGIGVNAVAAARAAGAARIVAVDIDPRKERIARHFGADEFVTDISTIAGADSTADVVIECSGAPAAISAASALADGGAGRHPPGRLRVERQRALIGARPAAARQPQRRHRAGARCSGDRRPRPHRCARPRRSGHRRLVARPDRGRDCCHSLR